MIYKKANGVHHYSGSDYSKRIAFLKGVLYGLFMALLSVIVVAWFVVKFNFNLFK